MLAFLEKEIQFYNLINFEHIFFYYSFFLKFKTFALKTIF